MTDAEPRPADVAATFCATLVDEWARAGVTHACIAPGSRSTPLALALAADSRLEISVHHDERSAGFVALGLGLATRRPAIVLTTSGTAAAELHASVIEAHQAGVPMVIATADRPPELREVGAPQTIDQTRLFGRSVRLELEPGVPAVGHAPHLAGDRRARRAGGVGCRPGKCRRARWSFAPQPGIPRAVARPRARTAGRSGGRQRPVVAIRRGANRRRRGHRSLPPGNRRRRCWFDPSRGGHSPSRVAGAGRST